MRSRRACWRLKDKLVSSEAVAEAVRAYAKETNRLNRDRRAQTKADQKALRKMERATAGIMAAIEDGAISAVDEGADGRA